MPCHRVDVTASERIAEVPKHADEVSAACLHARQYLVASGASRREDDLVGVSI